MYRLQVLTLIVSVQNSTEPSNTHKIPTYPPTDPPFLETYRPAVPCHLSQPPTPCTSPPCTDPTHPPAPPTYPYPPTCPSHIPLLTHLPLPHTPTHPPAPPTYPYPPTCPSHVPLPTHLSLPHTPTHPPAPPTYPYPPTCPSHVPTLPTHLPIPVLTCCHVAGAPTVAEGTITVKVIKVVDAVSTVLTGVPGAGVESNCNR